MRLVSIALVLVAVGISPGRAEARSFRLSQVPNGSQFGCALCHNNAQGGGPRNGFGAQVENTLEEPKETADVNWAAIYDQDGDADGYSNGFELGDPDGEWMDGDPNPGGDVYGPQDRTDSPCGDGVLLNPPEECDGEELDGVTCEDLGWGPGTLTCNSACRFNESQCEGWEPPNGAPGNNQTTGATNQNTTGATNGETDGVTNSAPTDVDETEPTGCCATVHSGSTPVSIAGLLFALLLVVRRNRRDVLAHA